MRSQRPDLRYQRPDLRPEGPNEGAGGTNGRTNERTDGRTKESPPVFYRTLSPSTIIDFAYFSQRPCVIDVIYHSLSDDMLFSSIRSVVFKFCIKLHFGHRFGRNVFGYFPFLIAS